MLWRRRIVHAPACSAAEGDPATRTLDRREASLFTVWYRTCSSKSTYSAVYLHPVRRRRPVRGFPGRAGPERDSGDHNTFWLRERAYVPYDYEDFSHSAICALASTEGAPSSPTVMQVSAFAHPRVVAMGGGPAATGGEGQGPARTEAQGERHVTPCHPGGISGVARPVWQRYPGPVLKVRALLSR